MLQTRFPVGKPSSFVGHAFNRLSPCIRSLSFPKERKQRNASERIFSTLLLFLLRTAALAERSGL
jgi:hypothetical protein